MPAEQMQLINGPQAWRQWIEWHLYSFLEYKTNLIEAPFDSRVRLYLFEHPGADLVSALEALVDSLKLEQKQDFVTGLEIYLQTLPLNAPRIAQILSLCVRLGARFGASGTVAKFREVLMSGSLSKLSSAQNIQVVGACFAALALRATDKDVMSLVREVRARADVGYDLRPLLLNLACRSDPSRWPQLLQEELEVDVQMPLSERINDLVTVIARIVKLPRLADDLVLCLERLSLQTWPIVIQAVCGKEGGLFRLRRPDDVSAEAFKGWYLEHRKGRYLPQRIRHPRSPFWHNVRHEEFLDTYLYREWDAKSAREQLVAGVSVRTSGSLSE